MESIVLTMKDYKMSLLISFALELKGVLGKVYGHVFSLLLLRKYRFWSMCTFFPLARGPRRAQLNLFHHYPDPKMLSQNEAQVYSPLQPLL